MSSLLNKLLIPSFEKMVVKNGYAWASNRSWNALVKIDIESRKMVHFEPFQDIARNAANLHNDIVEWSGALYFYPDKISVVYGYDIDSGKQFMISDKAEVLEQLARAKQSKNLQASVDADYEFLHSIVLPEKWKSHCARFVTYQRMIDYCNGEYVLEKKNELCSLNMFLDMVSMINHDDNHLAPKNSLMKNTANADGTAGQKIWKYIKQELS